MKILVVDDDQNVLDLLSLVLKQEGHTDVVLETSALAAIEILKAPESHFDCLIFDIQMPELDGIELCKITRRLPNYCATPIVMLTAKADLLSIESAFSAGANDYITKPFDILNISSRIGVVAKVVSQDVNYRVGAITKSNANQVAGDHNFYVDDPIILKNTPPGLTDHFSLGNYLVQLERTLVSKSLVVAIRIGGIQELYEETTSWVYTNILDATAIALTSILSDYRSLTAYMGDGIYMVICEDRMQHLWPEMEERVEASVKKALIQRKLNDLSGFNVSVGRPCRPSSSKTKRVGPTFEKAIAAARRREAQKIKEMRSKERRFIF